MDVTQGIVVFFLIWWTFIFCVLPFFYRRQEDEPGIDRPKPKFIKIFIYTTLLSVLVWLIVYGLIRANVLDFYALANAMVIKDGLQ